MLSSNWISPPPRLDTIFTPKLRFKPFILSVGGLMTDLNTVALLSTYFPCMKLYKNPLTLGCLIHQSNDSWKQIDRNISIYPNVQQKESLVVPYSQFHRLYQQPLECLFCMRYQHCCKWQSFGSTLRSGSILKDESISFNVLRNKTTF